MPSVKHPFVSAKSDGADATQVQPSNWNADHDITMATARILGRTTAGTGAVEELTVGAGLTLSAGALAVVSNSVNVQDFTTPGTTTWIHHAGAKLICALLFAGGAGGGAGRRRGDANVAGQGAGGGGGGSGGGMAEIWIAADLLPPTVSVTVGAGGAGASAATSDGSSGSGGDEGGNSLFGTWAKAVGKSDFWANSGGFGGTQTARGAGGDSYAAPVFKSLTQNGDQNIFNNSSYFTGQGGGAGGPPGFFEGSMGGRHAGGGGAGNFLAVGSTADADGHAGGLGGAAVFNSLSDGRVDKLVGGGGAAQSNGADAPNFYVGGSGGGGGNATSTTAGSGGNGGFPGGGGGGGAPASGSFNSGAGGNGGGGRVVVLSFF